MYAVVALSKDTEVSSGSGMMTVKGTATPVVAGSVPVRSRAEGSEALLYLTPANVSVLTSITLPGQYGFAHHQVGVWVCGWACACKATQQRLHALVAREG